jgi:hypothetical protein
MVCHLMSTSLLHVVRTIPTQRGGVASGDGVREGRQRREGDRELLCVQWWSLGLLLESADPDNFLCVWFLG